MSKTLTRDDFRSVQQVPQIHSHFSEDLRFQAGGIACEALRWHGMFTPAPSVVGSPVSPQVIDCHLSLAALTRKSISSKRDELIRDFREALELAETMAAEDEAAPHNVQTWLFAVQELVALSTDFDLPLPLILPLQNGGVGAEWHECGLDIELRFRSPYQIYVVIEDARGVLAELHHYDSNLVRARAALRELATRLAV